MTVTAHIAMSRAIHEIVEMTVPVSLSRRWFMYGNVYPDISYYSLAIPHYPAKSMEFVRRLILSLCQTPISADGKVDPIFALQTGMLCHYICDFFCHAHSESFGKSKPAHLAYEMRQQAYITRHPNSLSRRTALNIRFNGMLPTSADEIIEWLDSEQTAYAHQIHTAVDDLFIAVQKASAITSCIFAICLQNAHEHSIPAVPVIA